MSELPENWVFSTLNKICEVQGGFAFKSKDYKETGIPLLRISNIKDEKISFDEKTVYLDEFLAIGNENFFLNEGDILIALSGATTGKYGKYTLTKAALLNQRVGRIRVKNNKIANSNYIYYFLGVIKNWIINEAYGAAQPNISTRELGNIAIPLPPLPEQHRIVAKIEELFSRLDAGVKALETAKAQLKRYRRSVLKSAVEGRLTAKWREAHKDELEPADKLLERVQAERKARLGKKYKEPEPVDATGLPQLPEGWVWSRIKEIGEIVTGTTPSKKKPEYYGGDIPFYKPTDLNNGYHVLNSTDSLTEDGLIYARLLPIKSILVTCIGATIGKTGFIRTPGASNQQINAVIPLNVHPEFIYYLCISPFFQKEIINNSSSTTLPILNKSKFESLPIMIPPYKEQVTIVKELDRIFSIINESERVIESELKRARSLRQSILKRVFEGKLVPQDPHDEPASVLLERIKKEKEEANA